MTDSVCSKKMLPGAYALILVAEESDPSDRELGLSIELS